jgi:large subunit ribosomal protein L30
MATLIEVTQKRSTIGRPADQGKVIKGLGLRRLNHTVRLKDTPAIRGMIMKVQHLVDVRVLEGEAEIFGRRAKK